MALLGEGLAQLEQDAPLQPEHGGDVAAVDDAPVAQDDGRLDRGLRVGRAVDALAVVVDHPGVPGAHERVHEAPGVAGRVPQPPAPRVPLAVALERVVHVLLDLAELPHHARFLAFGLPAASTLPSLFLTTLPLLASTTMSALRIAARGSDVRANRAPLPADSSRFTLAVSCLTRRSRRRFSVASAPALSAAPCAMAIA